jgi:hypothetical protein
MQARRIVAVIAVSFLVLTHTAVIAFAETA